MKAFTPIVFATASFLLSLSPSVFAQSSSSSTDTMKEKPESKSKALLRGFQEAFSDVAEKAAPCVVTISGSRRSDKESRTLFGRGRLSTGSGSGVMVRSDGWILTNDHVVGSADRVTVKFSDGKELSGRVVRDFRSDLALVKIEGKEPFPTAKLGDSDALKVGYWAIAVGSPYGYEGSVSVGIVSSLHRRQEIADSDTPDSARFYPNMIQTDAAINPGNSGGPLYNLDGEVIGINTAIESEGGGSVGIGFSIPINTAKFVMKQLIASGKVRYGYLGVMPAVVTPRLASSLKVERGAFVEDEPVSDSPAAKAGVHAGDVVIAIDGRPLLNDVDLRNFVAQTPPGTTISLKVVRKERELTLKATLVEPPDRVPTDAGKRKVPAGLGLEVITLTPSRARDKRLPKDTKGVIIQRIDPDSAAADNEELMEGLVIISVNDRDTPTLEIFRRVTEKYKSGDTLRLLCLLGSDQRIVTLSVE